MQYSGKAFNFLLPIYWEFVCGQIGTQWTDFFFGRRYFMAVQPWDGDIDISYLYLKRTSREGEIKMCSLLKEQEQQEA